MPAIRCQRLSNSESKLLNRSTAVRKTINLRSNRLRHLTRCKQSLSNLEQSSLCFSPWHNGCLPRFKSSCSFLKYRLQPFFCASSRTRTQGDFILVHERPNSRGCDQVTYYPETCDLQLACDFLFVSFLARAILTRTIACEAQFSTRQDPLP